MTHRNLFRSIALTTGAALIGIAGANAQAQVSAGNYQTHVVSDTTRHTAEHHDVSAHSDYRRVAKDNAAVQSGNYQTHVMPRSTRRTADADSVDGRHDEVVMSGSADRR
ncbi:hypothetical protein V5738_14200 [Salinisphaera sp. SPP-AMP-43]|uniref:hypothetical protein n=1 Tax=Salinisphaera sp. SPP-AMP-43 TaxID=3121288 RepID=UPI003C6E099B